MSTDTEHLRSAGTEPPRLRHRILRAGGWVTAGFVLDKVIAALQLVVLARLLTPADFGLMAASAIVLMALMTVSEVGLEPALVARQAKVRREDLAVAWSLSLSRGCVLAAVLWVGAGVVADFFRMPALVPFLRVHAVALILQGAQSPALALLLRNLHLRQRVSLDLTRRVVEAAVTIGLALWLHSAWALLMGQLVGFGVGCVGSYVVAPFRPHLAWDVPALRRFLWYAKYANLTSLFAFGVVSGGEFVIGRVLGIEALGVYQVAMAIPMLIGVRASLMLNQISFPAYAMLRHDRAGMLRAFSLQIGLVGLLLVPLGAGLAVLAPELVPVLFGPRWLPTVEPLRILSLYAVGAGFAGVMSSLHYGLNRPDVQTRLWAIQFVVFAILIVPLTTRFGVSGAATALALSFGVAVMLNIVATVRLLGAESRIAFWPLGRIGLLAGALAGIVVALRGLHPEPTPWWLLGAWLVVGVGTYALYLWWVEYPRLRALWVKQPG
ncbi:MAG: oligosaccharide flippase family protein [Nitrospirales bacterium]